MKDLITTNVAGPLGRTFPMGRFPDIFSQLDRMMDYFWSGHNWDAKIFEEIQPKGRFPKINVRSLDDKYVVEIAVAGFDKSDIDLELRDNCLLIKADKRDESKESEDDYIYREIARRSFSRVVRFPEKVDGSDIECSYKDGLVVCSISKLLLEDKKDSIKIKID